MNERSTLGYCAACMQNIPHVRQIRNPLLRVVDQVTLEAIRLLRFGHWHCAQCGQTSIRLKSVRRDAPSYRFAESRTGEGRVESVGNFIRSDQSLVLRRKRAGRYSQKYRDGIVNRLIGGTVTISQLGRELSVSEVDIVDWIADLLARKQERIDELTEMLSQLPMSSEFLIGHDSISYADEDVIEGSVPPH